MAGKLGVLVNPRGLIVDWACATANVYDGSAFQALLDDVADQLLVVSDTGFEKRDWRPTNLKIGQRGEWNSRLLIESVWSMVTLVGHLTNVSHRIGTYVERRLGYTLALFNLLVQGHGLQPDENGSVPLSIPEFSL